MATIIRREIFIEVDNRKPLEGTFHRPCDWALTLTSLGTMAEPFHPFSRNCPNTSIQNYDATDEMRRIDEIRFIDLDKHMSILSGGGDPIHGGNLLPRTGR